MSLTQSSWTVTREGGPTFQNFKAVCTVAATTAESDAYTVRTPHSLNPNKPWNLAIYASGTPDGQALPVDIWGLLDDAAQLTGDGATVAPDTTNAGVRIKNIIDDMVLAVSAATAYHVHLDPNLAIAEVVAVATGGLKSKIPVYPAYAINCNGGSTLAAVTFTFIITQPV